MNWNKIKEKNPKAYEKCRVYFGLTKETDYYLTISIEDRCLYDFFDEQGIIIEISFHPDKGWYAYINTNYIDVNRMKTRTEAETVAFEKAFDILEKK